MGGSAAVNVMVYLSPVLWIFLIAITVFLIIMMAKICSIKKDVDRINSRIKNATMKQPKDHQDVPREPKSDKYY